ncbi:MAG: hypothetical protein LC733_11920, partial [Actinobacteria bacterium]|nr:hypothetical protein [Actinomycetota bacterium]
SPRRYEVLALELLEDLAEVAGPETVDAVLARRTDRMVAEYETELAGAGDLHEKVQRVARLRDEAGYVAECRQGEGDDLLLVENNCAVHRVAAEHGTVCSMELTLLSRVLGPDAEVTRVSHTMGGDAVCCYRVRPRPPEDGRRQ